MVRRGKRFAGQDSGFERFGGATLCGRLIGTVRSVFRLRQFAAVAPVTTALAPAATMPAVSAVASTAIAASKITAAASA